MAMEVMGLGFDQDSISREVVYLHACLFGLPPNERLILEYCRAHHEISDLRGFDSAQVRSVELIVEMSLDAVGIEPWLRRSGRRHPLTSKLLLLSYLKECLGDGREYDRNFTRESFVYLRIAFQLILAFARLTRGLYQKKRYGLR